MKKYIFLSIIAVLMLSSCEDVVFDPVLTLGAGPNISEPSSGANIVLKEETATNPFPAIKWSAAEFGFQAGVTYKVEIDRAGANFANPLALGTVINLELNSLTNEKINSLLLSNDYPGEAIANMEIRVGATVNPEVETLYSDPLPINITPYTVEIDYPKLQVPGSYQGWDPANETTVIFSLKSDGKFEGYLNFPDPNVAFKYTEGPSWDVNWGDSGADGVLDPSGDDIIASDAGLYKLNVDLNDKTHTYVKTDWGVIGDATPTGWDSDTDFTYDADSGTLKVTLDLAADKFIKFRANDDWAINLGDDDTNGDLQYGGADIPIGEAGNYTIELILNQARYTYKLTKN